jgi:hypothetical protein
VIHAIKIPSAFQFRFGRPPLPECAERPSGYKCLNGCFFVAVDPSGKFVYAVDFFEYSAGFGGVFENTIHTTSGALTAIPGSPVPTGWSTSIAVSGEIH